MGLDGVEIVMAVEETFDIVVEDSEAQRILTPGHLIELVLSKVGRTTHAACLTQRAFHRIRASLLRQLDYKRNQIKVETPLTSLFPHPGRKEQLRKILTDIGLDKEISLARPKWLCDLILAAVFSGSISVAVFLSLHPVNSRSVLINLVFGSSVFSGFLFLVTSSAYLQ